MAEYFVVSNRGPYSAYLRDGQPALKRGAGGLVTAMLPLVRQGTMAWTFPISTEPEAAALSEGLYGKELPGLDPVPVDPSDYDGAYNRISNEILWYMNHGMFSLSRTPSFDSRFYTYWKQYSSYNEVIAEHLAETLPQGAAVLLQDYHVFLVPKFLRGLRPDLRLSLFLHTPFADPGEFSVLPSSVASELLTSLGNLDRMGFHSHRWKDNYLATAKVNGAHPAGSAWVRPLGSDLGELQDSSRMPAVAERTEELASLAKGRRIIGRVDRMEPSKNILRGIEAVVELFKFYPWRMLEVVHIANCYPSRGALNDYASYASEVIAAAEEANTYLRAMAKMLGFEPPGDPIEVMSVDDYALSIALLRQSDVLLVNPIRDGLNLVASEGPLLNLKDCPLVLSRNAGIAEVVDDAAQIVNPFDVRETALALFAALQLDEDERKTRSAKLRSALAAHSPTLWMEAQISD
ncbi:MAG: trehalose-6-phosphate synthase [Actinomycetota bacterium]|nr:trehalose-6-phosphate synthase [Actinomycetota bacterium]